MNKFFLKGIIVSQVQNVEDSGLTLLISVIILELF